MDYGERKCIVCGKIFIASKPSTVTCSLICWKDRRKQVHKDSYYKRKDYVARLVEERDALLLENLELKKRLGIISAEEAVERTTPPAAKEPAKEVPPMSQEHVCLACGKVYKPTGTRQRFCSRECRERFQREQG